MLKKNAAIEVKDSIELKKVIALLIKDTKIRYEMGLSAKAAIEENRGATDKNIQYLKSFL